MKRAEIEAALAGGRMLIKRTGLTTDAPSPEQIARLAYRFYEKRGRGDGQDLDDWLSAERELALRYR